MPFLGHCGLFFVFCFFSLLMVVLFFQKVILSFVLFFFPKYLYEQRENIYLSMWVGTWCGDKDFIARKNRISKSIYTKYDMHHLINLKLEKS